VQSHYFGVGAIVGWAQAGVGAIANQSVPGPRYGPRGLELMREGASAPQALQQLFSDDEHEAVRQVACLDRRGRVAAHSGARCMRHAGHRVADGISAQANIMKRPTVPDAMLKAYQSAPADLADRMLAALEAAEAEGGDLRGRQSASLLVVAEQAGGDEMEERSFDLRVEDHHDAVAELGRLVALRRAYRRVDVSDELAAAGDFEGAFAEYTAAHESHPDNAELAFWRGVALAAHGREDEARALLQEAYRQDDGWQELLRRLPAAGLIPDDPPLLDRLG
jgi:uncharacterized Ntn-hydrolase superfamily protein